MKLPVGTVLVALLSLATCCHAHESLCVSKAEDTLSRIILKFLDKLRAHMSTGIPSMGIPPLDPLRVDGVHDFHVRKSGTLKVDGDVSNTVVENLSSFNVSSISSSLLRMQANMTVIMPYFIVTGSYSLSGKLLSLIPVDGKGPYLLTPSAVATSITSTFRLEHKHIQLTSLDFDFDFKHLFVKFEGLYGGGGVGSLLNALANRFGVAVFHRIEPRVHQQLRVALVDAINKELKEIPLAELVSLVAGSYSCRSEIRDLVRSGVHNNNLD